MLRIILINCLLFVIPRAGHSALLMSRKEDSKCGEIPKEILEEVLGASYNPRYMSIDPPVETAPTGTGMKRASNFEMDFYVDDTHYEELAGDPAWMVKNHVKIQGVKHHSRRFKRSVKRRQEWQCDSVIVWKDLGPDYFPRFLRTVECTQSDCWYSLFRCEPRSFTVKILRKKKNLCVLAERGMIIGYSGLPRDLRELWVWEERAVNFCCDCVNN
ncbi:protein trunk [Coccinella septempunctata]|uniref:protein trunk n=1 Tax=Coccinella septempunctata TaxID=41139 RepID=UPI001D080565|nr:protein trunk [Coccinella septempunctata]